MIGFNIGAEAGIRAGENEGERILGLRLGRSRKKQAGEVSPLSHRELQVLMHCTEFMNVMFHTILTFFFAVVLDLLSRFGKFNREWTVNKSSYCISSFLPPGQ